MHSDDELNLRHLQLLVRLGLLELEQHDHRDVHNDCLPPLTSAPSPSRTIRDPTLGLPGAALDRCNNDRRIALYAVVVVLVVVVEWVINLKE